jgi:hypothetical protein
MMGLPRTMVHAGLAPCIARCIATCIVRRIATCTVRCITTCIAIGIAIACGPRAATAAEDMAGYFASYYRQQVVGQAYRGPLAFLQDAAAAHKGPDEVLRPTPSRMVLIDASNAYLRIDDSADTDQVLTMAIYRRADGGRLLVADSSNCADACDLALELFAPGAGRLDPVKSDAVLPRIAPLQFIKPGSRMPDRLKSIAPSIDYLPARQGTTLTLKPWYGYEAEEQLRKPERDAIRSIVLDWDRNRGRFVMRP